MNQQFVLKVWVFATGSLLVLLLVGLLNISSLTHADIEIDSDVEKPQSTEAPRSLVV